METRRISDRAIAQAFWEFDDCGKHSAEQCAILAEVFNRARELDATAAPVVVGEVSDSMVRAALCCRPFMGQQYDDETVFDMFAKLPAEKRKEAMRFAIAAALAGD